MALNYTKGTISHMSEVTGGTSSNGNEWRKMTVLLDVPGYQGSITKLAFQAGTNMVDNVLEFKVGDKVEVGWSIYAREWNGKWYNNVDLVNIKHQEAAPAPRQTQVAAPVQQKLQPQDLDPAAHADDMPF